MSAQQVIGSAQAIRVEDHVPLIHAVIRSHGFDNAAVRGSLEVQDLVQHGAIGLMRAAERYDADAGPWGCYAWQWIRQAIGRAIHNEACDVRVPVFRQTQARKAGQRQRPKHVSFNAPARNFSDDGEGASLIDMTPCTTTPAPDAELEASDAKVELEALLARVRLTDQERHVLEARFLRNETLTLTQVGEGLGLTRERIRQVELQALTKLRLSATCKEPWRLSRKLRLVYCKACAQPAQSTGAP